MLLRRQQFSPCSNIYFRYTSRHLSQGALKMPIQCVADGVRIVTRIGFQAAVTGEGVNFRVAYLDRDAAQPVSPPLSVCAHALSRG
jgi:hypothetical protein